MEGRDGGKMNPRYSDLRLPTEMQATGWLRLAMTTGSRVSFTSSISVRQRALNGAADIVFRTISRVSWSS